MDNKRLEDYMNYCYSLKVIPDQTTDSTLCYLAMHPELSGCMSHGETPGEAIANLFEAKKLYFATMIEKNLPIPMPILSTNVIWEESGVMTEEQISQESSFCQPFFVQSEINPIQTLGIDIRNEVGV
ncbi:MAG: type II toxin-antitoxin system HicB family antitoxin [Candidatus Omnitrophota bacterium]